MLKIPKLIYCINPCINPRGRIIKEREDIPPTKTSEPRKPGKEFQPAHLSSSLPDLGPLQLWPIQCPNIPSFLWSTAKKKSDIKLVTPTAMADLEGYDKKECLQRFVIIITIIIIIITITRLSHFLCRPTLQRILEAPLSCWHSLNIR